jgi:hypothetical protein
MPKLFIANYKLLETLVNKNIEIENQNSCVSYSWEYSKRGQPADEVTSGGVKTTQQLAGETTNR